MFILSAKAEQHILRYICRQTTLFCGDLSLLCWWYAALIVVASLGTGNSTTLDSWIAFASLAVGLNMSLRWRGCSLPGVSVDVERFITSPLLINCLRALSTVEWLQILLLLPGIWVCVSDYSYMRDVARLQFFATLPCLRSGVGRLSPNAFEAFHITNRVCGIRNVV